ncbi:MAG: polyphosphate polymerase domain-containing protein [Oscillospiraceae bacterium]|jgi:SPX domain protein involved in polyphosphate accumulation|nr:polyphosphate polymerase domain-containing protein [Oscillospiraceae bacterium]
MAIEVFNRRENKYRVSEQVMASLQGDLSDYMSVDSYNEEQFAYPICNIYYDTDDNRFISASLSKPLYKEKLRLRSYGVADLDSVVYLEIKKKFGGVVNKRRSGILLGEAYEFIQSGVIPTMKPYMNEQVLREIAYILGRHEVKPKVCISYERRAFFSQADPDLRVSFDTNILTRRTDLRLDSGIYGKQLIQPNEWLMEIKTSKNYPLWLARLLSKHKVYPQSFSKYGTEYAARLSETTRFRAIEHKQEEITKCLIPLSAQ